jgi:cysteine-rich repeat protein
MVIISRSFAAQAQARPLRAVGPSGGVREGGHIDIQAYAHCAGDAALRCSDDSQCDVGDTCDIASAFVNIRSNVVASGAIAGRLSVSADGDVTLGAATNVKTRASAGEGGSVDLVSSHGSVRVTGRIKARGGAQGVGGEVSIDADGEVLIDGNVDLRGGAYNGGSFVVRCSGSTRINRRIRAGSRTAAGFGGEITIDSDAGVTLGPQARVRSSGYESEDLAGGGGHQAYLSVNGDVVFESGSAVGAYGFRPSGFGVSVDIVAGGSVVLAGRVRVGAGNGYGGGPILEVHSDDAITIAPTAIIKTGGLIGAPVLLRAQTSVTHEGSIELRSMSEEYLYALEMEAGRSVDIAGAISLHRIVGSSDAEPGLLKLSACDVALMPTALVELQGAFGASTIAAVGRIRIEGGARLLADMDTGSHTIVVAEHTPAPVIDGTVVPAAVIVVDPLLDTLECLCGDGELDGGEECDDGNVASGDGCSDICECEGAFPSSCPRAMDIVSLAPAGDVCATNADCAADYCDSELGRCVAASQHAVGWTGLAHNRDGVDGARLRVLLDCGNSDPCGECTITGVDPDPGNCRCANDNRQVCDEPFSADADDCGGDICNCYLGPPEPISAGNTPTCEVPSLAVDVSGTVNVDTGERLMAVRLQVEKYLGINLFLPCPYCDGDTVAGDGLRDGVCMGRGPSEGLSCDADAVARSFPAPGGAGSSLDCMPDPGKNVTGTGLRHAYSESTGTDSLGLGVECGFPPYVAEDCHCGLCSNDLTGLIPCSSDGHCPEGGICQRVGNLDPRPNDCNDTTQCVAPEGESVGECATGPDNSFCDGILRANGKGFVGCVTNADCDASNIGKDAGACTIVVPRSCFTGTITATGMPDPTLPIVQSIYCSGRTSGAGINTVYGLPGPVRLIQQQVTTAYCTTNPDVPYTPGGACP